MTGRWARRALRRDDRRPRRRRDERGSILPLTILTMTILLGFTAFAADLGLQRVAVRDMQSVADVVALDAARKLPTCDVTTLTTAANASLARQNRRIGRTSPLVVTPGHLDSATKTFVAGAANGVCDAVKVESSTTVDYAFAPVLGRSSGGAARSAVGARAQPAVCFSAGTRSLVLNSSQSALSPLLDRILKANLGLVGYSGLVDLKALTVRLGDVAAELGIGTTQQLATATVTLRQLMVATATVLQRQGNTAQANLLNTVGGQVGALNVNLGRFLSVGTGGESGLDAQLNALDLIGTAALSAAVANGKNAVAIGADLGVPLDLVTANTQLTLIEPPVIACGGVGAQARTAQVRLDVKTGVSILGIAGIGNISLGVQVGKGTATLTNVTCAGGGTQASTTVRGDTSLATLSGPGGTGSATVTPLSLLGLPLAGVVRITGTVGAKTSTQQFPYPPAPDLTQIYGGGERIILSSVDSTTNTVLDAINKLTGTLDLLVQPLLKMLGIQLGIMEVRMLGTPSCSATRLAG